MLKAPHIFTSAPDASPSGLVNANTITLQGMDFAPVAMVTETLGDNGPGILAGVGFLCAVLLIVRRMSRKARAQKGTTQDAGENFAASVEIPPYVDRSHLASLAADIDPDEAVMRLSNTWMDARRKVEANPLYSPNSNECIARDAVEIERIFCSGQVAKNLAKQSPEAFERFAVTAETLGAPQLCGLIGEAKTLAIKGHSPDMQDAPRKGDDWIAFRKEIAALETRFRTTNSANGSAGRLITLADAYMSEIAA